MRFRNSLLSQSTLISQYVLSTEYDNNTLKYLTKFCNEQLDQVFLRLFTSLPTECMSSFLFVWNYCEGTFKQTNTVVGSLTLCGGI